MQHPLNGSFILSPEQGDAVLRLRERTQYAYANCLNYLMQAEWNEETAERWLHEMAPYFVREGDWSFEELLQLIERQRPLMDDPLSYEQLVALVRTDGGSSLLELSYEQLRDVALYIEQELEFVRSAEANAKADAMTPQETEAEGERWLR